MKEHRVRKKFPTFAFIIFVLALLWFLSGLGIITNRIPWFPLIIMIIALGWLINHHKWEK